MVIKVGINGFGRIGRVVFRTCLENSEIQVCAINDPGISVVYISYLIKFDTTHGKFKGTVAHSQNQVIVDGRPIYVFHNKAPTAIPWDVAEIKYVIETSGMFTTHAEASGHLQSKGVSRVIVTAPSVDIPMFILGVNDDDMSPDVKVISTSSSTLYCLAPIIKILKDQFGLEEGFLTSIRAMSPSFKPLDGLCIRGKLWRNHRCIHQNITPAKTGVCKALAKIIPDVKDKVTGIAFKIPVVNVSMLDLTIRLSENTDLLNIIKQVEEKSSTTMRNIIKTSRQSRDSSGYIGESHSCILDILSSIQLKSKFYKLICWYENDFSYACRIIETVQMSERKFQKQREIFQTDNIVRPVLPVKIKRRNVVKSGHPAQNNSKVNNNIAKVMDVKIECAVPDASINLTSRKKSSSNLNNDIPTEGNGEGNFRNYIHDKIVTPEDKIDRTYKQRQNSAIQQNANVTANNKARNDLLTSKTLIRLETVRKELSKMVNITEDLLQKSLNCKVSIKPESEVQKITKEKKPNEEKTFKLQIKKSFSLLEKYLNDSYDYQSKDNGIKSDKTKEVQDFNKMKDIKNVTSQKTRDSPMNGTTLDKENSQKSGSLYNEDISWYQSTDQSNYSETKDININKTELNRNNTNQTDDSIAGDYEKATESIKLQNSKKFEKSLEPTLAQFDFQSNSYKTRGDFANTNSSVEKEKVEKYFFQNNKQLYSLLINKSNEKSEKVANLYTTEETKSNTASRFNEFEDERSITETNKNKEDKHIGEETANPRIIEMQDELPCSTKNLELPSNPSTNSTVSTKGLSDERKDIYDKLDNASVVSATDSYHSFEVIGKTSEVISISELTKSIEDLDNINKICRIIEISDELSDKLFLPLNNQSNDDPKATRKWSLKNLCERIKLDDFCNEVFGK